MDRSDTGITGSGEMITGTACRSCGTGLKYTFADLNISPAANSYISPGRLGQMEPFYPLHAFVCDRCFLVQLPVELRPEEIFSDYAYFSSYSESWLMHARQYAEQVIGRFGINSKSMVVEIASNDGYLLQYFLKQGVPVLGVEPAANVADAAVKAGIPTLVRFFGTETAKEMVKDGTRADLLIGNNVLAHVPDLNDFVNGMKILLHEDGIITMEFPHLMRLIEENQFDTIYHEHFSYFSLIAVERVFSDRGLTIFDVEELRTHGGSLRIYACHDGKQQVEERVPDLRKREVKAGFSSLDLYTSFSEKVKRTKRDILEFLIGLKRSGKTIAGYGAPAKGNTLLNYCGIGRDFIDYTVDLSPHKQGHFLPGSRIPILSPGKVKESRPDYLLILPWNLRDEIMKQMSFIRDWGGKFIVLIPEIRVFE